MPFEILLALAGFSLASSVTPGPNNLMLLASGVNFGFRRTMPHMLGIVGGFASCCCAVGFGLGAVLRQVPALHLAIKVVGGVYLLFTRMEDRAPRDRSERGNAAHDLPRRPRLPVGQSQGLGHGGHRDVDLYGSDALRASVLLVGAVFAAINVPCISRGPASARCCASGCPIRRRLRFFNVTMALLLVASVALADASGLIALPPQNRAMEVRWIFHRSRIARLRGEPLAEGGRPQVFRLFGYAGTGKTTLARHFAEHVDGEVLFAAFTGKAAQVLRSQGRDQCPHHPFADLPAARRGGGADEVTGKTSISPTFSINRQSPVAQGQADRHRRMLDGRRAARPRPAELRHADPGARRSRPVAADLGRRLLHRAGAGLPADRDPPPGARQSDHPAGA